MATPEHSVEEGTTRPKKKSGAPKEDVKVTYKLRDLNTALVDAWNTTFKDYSDQVEVITVFPVYLCKI